MSIALKIDTRQLAEAMRYYAIATQKDEAEILNRAALNIAIQPYGTIRNTKVADRGEIEAKLRADDLAIKIAAKSLSGKAGKRGKRGGLLKNQGWKNRVGKAAKTLINRRKASATYARAGWIKAANTFGSVRQAAKKFSGSAIGYGSKATPQMRRAIIANTTKDITEVPGAFRALQSAVRGAALDMATHAQKTMAQTARRHSGR